MSQTPERHRHVRAIFDEALLQDPSRREAYVDRACASDPDLRPDVMRLLVAHDKARSFLKEPPKLVLSAVRAEEHFTGTGRFRVMRRLGAGGMGVVYEVHDRLRDEVIALKTFLRTSAADLYRLKREFRSLADVAHANLVCLYELFVEGDRCFFTMERVKGVSFVEYARGPDHAKSDDRLIHALRQLIDGVSALHRWGKLHRDIKPSNVLVTAEGRVVILDFGLITELLPRNAADGMYPVGGTPAYMSPEESSGLAPSEASDWYAVGVTLYEALTGTLPFAGSVPDMLSRKAASDPPAPAEIAADVPAALSAICMGLLNRSPVQRLTGVEALGRLACDTALDAPDARFAAVSHDPPFIGRLAHLQLLNDAFDAVMDKAARVVSVHGPSGIGKSALVRRFLGQFGTRADVVVLSGRCYENESVPYKALDGVIDDLSRYLLSLPHGDVERLLPTDLPALTRVFPVMRQVPAIANAHVDRDAGTVDHLGLRRRAFQALRELTGRLADRRSLIICIDDLQWADADSVVLLEELHRPPQPPAMLTIVCFRSEETADKPFLQAILARAGRDMWSAISVEPMTDEEALALIEAWLPSNSPLTDGDTSVMTREAGGSPFVLEQLAQYAGIDRKSRGPTVSEMLATRLAALSPEARRFLETLAICGRPMAPELVCDACAVERERQSLVATLRSSHLIRSSGSSERIEPYHDRIREALAAGIVPEHVRLIHGRLVQVLVDKRSDDCEALFEHYRGAGDRENASIQASLAAAKAATALAFDRTAFFYRHALALTPHASSAHAWREGLANALANAGRPAEAAAAFLLAAEGIDHPRRVELQRRAAEQFLTGGHIDRGLDVLRTVLVSIGVRAPHSTRAALLSLFWHRARLRWRGLRFVARPVDEVDRDALLRIDTCWSATSGLGLVDPIKGSDFNARQLRMALDAGEPYRIARAMAMEAATRSATPRGRGVVNTLVTRSKTLAESVHNPHAMAVALIADGIAAMMTGEWKRVATVSEQALAILRDQCAGAAWELNIAQNLMIWSLLYRGELREVCRLVPPLLANARSSGNLYIATELCTRSNFVWLTADDPDEGERETIATIAQWSHKGFHRQHYSALLARVQTALYRGDAEAAWRLLSEQQSTLRRSLLTRLVQLIRIESHYLWGRVALAMARSRGTARPFLGIARARARSIARERMPWSTPIACLLKAGVAFLGGDRPESLRYLHDAADRFERVDMNLYLAVTRRRIGALQDDARGRFLKCQADEWMAAQTIKNPVAMTRMLAPGFPDSP